MIRSALPVGIATVALCACAAVDAPAPDPGPPAATIAVVARAWHTDVCIRSEDADRRVADLARGFAGARFLCLGFGERRYVTSGDHGVVASLAALLPSPAALLLTTLTNTPAEAFGEANVIRIDVDAAGLQRLRAWLARSAEHDDAGQPVRLRDGPYPGSAFFAATGTYELFHTCNTWTAEALQAAGLPISRRALLPGDVMRQAQRYAVAPSPRMP